MTVTAAAAAGLVFSNVADTSSKSGKPPKLACTGATANISCTINPEVPGGTGRTLSAQVSLVDQFGNTITPVSDVPVTLTTTGSLSVTSPVTIAAGSSSATFTGNLPDASGNSTPQGTVTATATVGGASLSAALTS